MIAKETLIQVSRGIYEEPDGEILEFVSEGANTVTVLTRVSSEVIEPPIDPTEYTVSELRDIVENDPGWVIAQADAVLDRERETKDRKSAIGILEDFKQSSA